MVKRVGYDGAERTDGPLLFYTDHAAEVERLRSELASEREARERAEGAADAVLRAGIGIIHDLDAAGVPRLAGEFPGPLENLSARVNDLRQRLEQVEAERDELRAMAGLAPLGAVATDALIASLKRELAAAQAICWSALLVLSEGVPDDGSQAPDSPLPLQLRIVGTAALDSYVADATADLRERVAELEKAIPPARFPVLGGPSIPWTFIAPHEYQAQQNHGQSLKRLAERGGCSPSEVRCIVEGRRFKALPDDDAWLRAWLKENDDATAAARAEGERAGEERAADIAEAARDFLAIIDKAGLLNLASGVQLGPTSWYAKASDARELLVDVLRNFGERARPSTKEEDGHAEDAE